MDQIHGVRKEYAQDELHRQALPEEPVHLLQEWLRDAQAVDPSEFNAMCLSTVDASGFPDARMVLAKDISAAGVSFFTNFQSTKGRQLVHFPRAALTFYWPALERQVRVRGAAWPLSEAENDDYFASRPRSSQLGAWASQQSELTDGAESLSAQYMQVEARFADQPIIPRPEHWGGFCVALETVEFWQGRPSRLHHRWRFRLENGGWVVEGLQP